MKKILILLMVVLGLGVYSYFGIIQKEQKAQKKNELHLLPVSAERLQKISIVSQDHQLELVKKKGLWWIVSPWNYLADQEYVEKALTVMHDTSVTNQFPLQTDRFGFEPGKAFYHLTYDDGLQKRLKIGEVAAPVEHLYILDTDSQIVSVVHNVWGQFVYFPQIRMLHPGLPIPGQMVKTLSLSQGEQQVWSVSVKDKSKVWLQWAGKKIEVQKPNMLWFFKKIREMTLKNLQFDKEQAPFENWVLQIESDQSNIRFLFNKEEDKIYLPQFKVIADLQPGSLKSISDELEKVIKSDKK